MKNAINILLILLFSSSCFDKNQKEIYLTNNITKLMQNLEKCYSQIIIIPGSGCSGCITHAENFLKKNHNNQEYLFILTNIKSLKNINHKIDLKVDQLSNIILDYDNVYSRYYMSIYPILIDYNCNKRKLENIIYQKPNSNVFDNI